MVSSPLSKIIISGATGWLGQELLACLEEENSGRSPYEILAISSRAQLLERPSGRSLITQTYDTLQSSDEVEGFVNLAFLTREKVAKIGYEEYVTRNLDLISRACQIITIQRPKWVVLVSSGAIFASKSNDLETNILENPYGFLKRIEELLISDAALKVGANVVIGRLWGATGRYMPINRAYAISDFISRGMAGEAIEIRSSSPVFRRFCDAGEFMNVLLKLARSGETLTLDSGGPLVEIGDLAALVASHFSEAPVLRATPNNNLGDDYYPRSMDFENISERLQISLSSIDQQVRQTVYGHSKQAHVKRLKLL